MSCFTVVLLSGLLEVSAAGCFYRSLVSILGKHTERRKIKCMLMSCRDNCRLCCFFVVVVVVFSPPNIRGPGEDTSYELPSIRFQPTSNRSPDGAVDR